MKILTLVLLLSQVLAVYSHAQIYDTNNEVVQTFAGFGIPGYYDGQGQLTEFSSPTQIVADMSSNLYVWDSGNSRIRKITANATVSTFVGGGNLYEGYGTNVSLSLYSIGSMLFDHSNILWVVAGFGNSLFFLNISTNDYVTIENGGSGLTNLSTSSSICFDSANNLYYDGGNRIYRYSPSSGTSQVFAGNGIAGNLNGQGTVFTEFSSPAALACDQADNIYVWDSANYRIRRIDQGQNVTSIAGLGYFYPYSNIDGVGTNASFNGGISSMLSDNLGNIYFACGGCIRKMNAQTNVVTMAGSFVQTGYTNGPGNIAQFNGAVGMCLSQGMIFVADSGNQRIRNIAFNPQPQVVSGANLGIGTYAGVIITGAVGRTYQVQVSSDMTNWATHATLLLTSSPYLWFDQNPVSGSKFYRALLMP